MLNQACNRCRSKKLRCSGGQPCAGCAKAGGDCLRRPRKKRVVSSRRRRPSSGGGGSPSLYDDTASTSLATAVSSIGPSTTTTTTSSSSSTSATSLSDTPPFPSAAAAHAAVLLHEARDAIGLSLDACHVLLSVSFSWRVMPLIHGCVHCGALQASARRLFDTTDDHFPSSSGAQSTAVTTDELLLLLLALSAAMLFTPPNGNNAEPIKLALAFSARRRAGDPGARQRAMYRLALRLLRARTEEQHGSLAVVQAVLLVILHGTETQPTLDAMLDRGMRWAAQLGLQRTSGFTIDDEMRVRTWWTLVVRNWLAGPVRWMYSVHPDQCSTRLPLNVDEADLERDLDGNALRAIERQWTTASYGLSLVSLAATVRTLVDMRNRLRREGAVWDADSASAFQAQITIAFDRMATTLPSIHAVERPFTSEVAAEHDLSPIQAARIDIERWLLHQQLFLCFFELHDVDSLRDRDDVPPACLALAHHILDSLDTYSRHCSVLRASALPVRSLTSAATAIAIHALRRRRRPAEQADTADFVKVAIAAGKAVRLSHARPVPHTLVRLEALVELWQGRMPDSVRLAAMAGREPIGHSEALLRLQISDAVDATLSKTTTIAPAQLWDANASWPPALQWAASGEEEQASGADRDASPSTRQALSLQQAGYSASMVPGLPAFAPAFQMDMDDDDDDSWEALYQRIISPD